MRKRDGGKFSLLRKGDGPCNIKQEINNITKQESVEKTV